MVRRLVLAFLVASALSACHISDPSQNQIETFSATVTQNGSSQQNFNVSKTGEITVTITNLQPSLPVSQYFGVLFGQQTSGQCALIGTPNNFGIVGTPAITSAIQPGAWCVVIFDVGFFRAATTYTYTMTISHP